MVLTIAACLLLTGAAGAAEDREPSGLTVTLALLQLPYVEGVRWTLPDQVPTIELAVDDRGRQVLAFNERLAETVCPILDSHGMTGESGVIAVDSARKAPAGMPLLISATACAHGKRATLDW